MDGTDPCIRTTQSTIRSSCTAKMIAPGVTESGGERITRVTTRQLLKMTSNAYVRVTYEPLPDLIGHFTQKGLLPRSLIYFFLILPFNKRYPNTSETRCRPHLTNSSYSTGSVELGGSAVARCHEHHRWFDKDAGRLLKRTRTVVCRKDQDENFFYEEVTYFMRS